MNWKERLSCSFQFFFFHPFLQTRKSARVTSRALHVLPRGLCTCDLEGVVNVSSNTRYHELDNLKSAAL
jgi:hypothetical protein